jgi:hypothetical protein
MTRKSFSFPSTAPPPAQTSVVISVRRLLLTETSSAGSGAPGVTLEHLAARARRLTNTFRDLEGYSHFGLNE